MGKTLFLFVVSFFSLFRSAFEIIFVEIVKHFCPRTKTLLIFGWKPLLLNRILETKSQLKPKTKNSSFFKFCLFANRKTLLFFLLLFLSSATHKSQQKNFFFDRFWKRIFKHDIFFSLFFLAVVLVGLPHLGFFRACEGVPLNIYSSYFVEYCCIFFVDFGHINFFSSRIYKEEECLYVLLQWKGLNQEDFESCFWKKSFIQNKWKKSAAAEMYAIGAIYWF